MIYCCLNMSIILPWGDIAVLFLSLNFKLKLSIITWVGVYSRPWIKVKHGGENESKPERFWVGLVGRERVFFCFFSCNVGSNEASGTYTPPFGTQHHPWRTKSRRLKTKKQTKQDERRNKQNHVTSSQIKLVPTTWRHCQFAFMPLIATPLSTPTTK